MLFSPTLLNPHLKEKKKVILNSFTHLKPKTEEVKIWAERGVKEKLKAGKPSYLAWQAGQ